MDSVKLYGINITALVSTSMTINQNLQSAVLVLTIVYTLIQIFQKLSKKQ